MIFDINNRFSCFKACKDGAINAYDYLCDSQNPLNKLGVIYLSGKIDQTIQIIYNDFTQIIRNSSEHWWRVNQLKNTGRIAGAYSASKEILHGASRFEQMLAINDWLSIESVTKVHTFFLSVHYGNNIEDYVSVKINPPNNRKNADTLNLILGASKGDRKAVKYAEMAINNPWDNRYQRSMALALDGLEIVRQPEYSGATVLKGNAFESGLISHDWRYGVYNNPFDPTSGYKPEACVELPRQRNGNREHKNQSAGNNLINLYNLLPDNDSDICYPVYYEDFTNRNRDDIYITAAPYDLLQALKISIRNNNNQPLHDELFKLFVGKIGKQQTKALKSFIAKKLFFVE